jgi:hypothetical protein
VSTGNLEIDAVVNLQLAAGFLHDSMADVAWYWDVLGDSNHVFWRFESDDTIAQSYELMLNDMVRAQRTYRQCVTEMKAAMAKVQKGLHDA